METTPRCITETATMTDPLSVRIDVALSGYVVTASGFEPVTTGHMTRALELAASRAEHIAIEQWAAGAVFEARRFERWVAERYAEADSVLLAA